MLLSILVSHGCSYPIRALDARSAASVFGALWSTLEHAEALLSCPTGDDRRPLCVSKHLLTESTERVPQDDTNIELLAVRPATVSALRKEMWSMIVGAPLIVAAP